VLKWKTPILMTSALNGEGITELAKKIHSHRAFLDESGEWEKRSQARALDTFIRLINEKLFENWQENVDPDIYNQVKKGVIKHQISPRRAIKQVFS
jgi:LAO/AO transport system kinase